MLRCTPAPRYSVTGWLHDGRPVTARRRDHLIVSGGRLTIRSFQHHSSTAETAGTDEGTYQCVASGPQGTVLSRPARLLTAGITAVIEFKNVNYLSVPIAIAYRGTDYKITCVLLSVFPRSYGRSFIRFRRKLNACYGSEKYKTLLLRSKSVDPFPYFASVFHPRKAFSMGRSKHHSYEAHGWSRVLNGDSVKAYFHYGCAALRFAAIVRDSL